MGNNSNTLMIVKCAAKQANCNAMESWIEHRIGHKTSIEYTTINTHALRGNILYLGKVREPHL